MDKYKVHLTFIEPILGTVTKDKEVYATYVQAKQVEAAAKANLDLTPAMLAEELDAVPNGKLEEKGWTGFHTVDGQPTLFDYVLKGYFKEAVSSLRKVEKSKSSKLTAYKKIIDGLVFIKPRRIPLLLPAGQSLGVLERPLRAQTMQGERVALARSDTAPAGTAIEFEIWVLGGPVGLPMLREWLDYGALKGLGQWRSASWGSFSYTIEEMI